MLLLKVGCYQVVCILKFEMILTSDYRHVASGQYGHEHQENSYDS